MVALIQTLNSMCRVCKYYNWYGSTTLPRWTLSEKVLVILLLDAYVTHIVFAWKNWHKHKNESDTVSPNGQTNTFLSTRKRNLWHVNYYNGACVYCYYHSTRTNRKNNRQCLLDDVVFHRLIEYLSLLLTHTNKIASMFETNASNIAIAIAIAIDINIVLVWCNMYVFVYILLLFNCAYVYSVLVEAFNALVHILELELNN